jgi:hypothetical protein
VSFALIPASELIEKQTLQCRNRARMTSTGRSSLGSPQKGHKTVIVVVVAIRASPPIGGRLAFDSAQSIY